jgi:hypothetical protein
VIRRIHLVHPDILAGNVEDGRKRSLPEGQCLCRLGDDEAAEHDPDAMRVLRDRDRMVWVRLFHDGIFSERAEARNEENRAARFQPKPLRSGVERGSGKGRDGTRLKDQSSVDPSGEISVTPSASASRTLAEPGFKGFCWLSCGVQPESQMISKVAGKRPSGSAKRSA